MENIKIFQNNVQSLRNCKDELREFLIKGNYLIACLQDTWLKNNEKGKD